MAGFGAQPANGLHASPGRFQYGQFRPHRTDCGGRPVPEGPHTGRFRFLASCQRPESDVQAPCKRRCSGLTTPEENHPRSSEPCQLRLREEGLNSRAADSVIAVETLREATNLDGRHIEPLSHTDDWSELSLQATFPVPAASGWPQIVALSQRTRPEQVSPTPGLRAYVQVRQTSADADHRDTKLASSGFGPLRRS